MGDTQIQWADKTLNPIRARNVLTGEVGWFCEHVSRGCGVPGKGGCYAEKMNENTYFGNGLPYKASSLSKLELFLDDKILMQPLHWRTPKKVFMCSMTDLFGRFVKDEWLDKIFAMMALAPQHTFQILTKRPERMLTYMQRLAKNVSPLEQAARAKGYTFQFDGIPLLPWPIPNIWLGVSIEDQPSADARREYLRETPAKTRIVSYEPAVGPVDWKGWEFVEQIISGGESGPKAEPSHPDWHRATRDFCLKNNIAYFLKQWGEWQALECIDSDWWNTVGFERKLPAMNLERCTMFRVGKKVAGRTLDGRTWDEFPEVKHETTT